MIPITRPALPPLERYTELLAEIWESRMLSNFADFAPRLEELVAGYLGVGHVRAVVSGDIGLMITLKALELPDGAPCFVSDFTFNSTVNAALWNRLRPVLVDIELDTFNLSSASLAAAMRRHPTPGVVLGTHVFGNPCDVEAIRPLAARHGHAVVFDAAHAYGSRRDGVPAGRLGDAEVFSLSGTKLVTSAEGGLITTPHDWLAERIDYLRAYGFQHDYVSHYVGLNGKMSELHAALGLLCLAEVEEAVAARAALVARYRERLGDAVGWQAVASGDRSTYKDVCLWLGSRRDAVEAALTAAGVGTKRYFVPLHTMPAYAAHQDTPLPVTEEVHRSTLCVPAFTDLGTAGVDQICDVILKALAPAGENRERLLTGS